MKEETRTRLWIVPIVFVAVAIIWGAFWAHEHFRSSVKAQEASRDASNPWNIEFGKNIRWDAVYPDKNVVDYGQGVTYFPVVEVDFGNMLAAYLVAHPSKEVSAMVPNIVRNDPKNKIVGYFVTFREKK